MDVNFMDNTPVNWSALDTLVLDYAEREQLLVESANGSSDFNLRCTVGHIRALIEKGELTEALDLIQQHAPSVLNDQRLLFRLHKQKFIELLRSGNVDARNQAIQCSRTVLGPCALDAYPEAYEEFKRLLLALIYNEDDECSPVADEWSATTRKELAATVASVLRAQLHAYDPILSLALRYLLCTHNSYCFRQGVTSPIINAADMLLGKEKDPPAAPHDYLIEAPNFIESDVQALAHAVDLQRQGAVDSLRYTGGDLVTAFKNEVSRMKLDSRFLDELVHDYCVYRGLIDCYRTSSLSTDTQSCVIVPEISDEAESSEIMNTSGQLKCESGVETVQERFRAHADAEEVIMKDQVDSQSEYSAAREPAQADCNASESHCSTTGSSYDEQFAISKKKHNLVRQRIQNSISHRSWKGRPTLMAVSGTAEDREIASSLVQENSETKNTAEEMKHSESKKYGIALEIRALASDGMIDEVIQEIKRLTPNFFEQHPHLLFQLKQVEFLKLVEMGNCLEALCVARSDMAPLAAKHSDLLKPLKETVLALARPLEDTHTKPIALPVLASKLQDAIGANLGITEPLLMKIMRAVLHTHTEWFKMQMCPDPFANILKIDELKNIDSAGLGTFWQTTSSETNGTAGSQMSGNKGGTRSTDGNLPQQSGSNRDGALFDDGSILTVMEWMALARGDAIQLLAQYNGNVENVFEHILS